MFSLFLGLHLNLTTLNILFYEICKIKLIIIVFFIIIQRITYNTQYSTIT